MNIPAPAYRVRRAFNAFCIPLCIIMIVLGVVALGPAITALGSVLLMVNTWTVADAARHIRERGLPRRPRRHIGEIYLSELPGFAWILLAGPEYWRQAAGILERRARKAEVAVVLPSKPRMSALPPTARDLLGPLPPGVSPRCPRGHPLTHPAACITCQNQRRP